MALPGHRLLVCDEMTAAGLARDPAGVDGAMRELGELLATDDPFDSLDSRTLAIPRRADGNALRF